jgi:hypothetical protein
VSYGALALLLVVLAVVPVGRVAAQDEGPRGDDGERGAPPRLVEREAPQREPRVLERTVTTEGAVNTVIELPAVADAYIASEWPNQNFGSDALYLGYHLVGEDNFGAERMVLRFDVLGNVPQGTVINDAQLRLRLNYSSPADDQPMGTILRRLCSNWSEEDVTWNREPAWREIRAEAEVGSTIDWYTWDVTGLVADWVARTHANHGVEIIGDEAVQQRERAFYSRETTSELYPRLVVDYTALNDTEPPEVTVDDLPAFVDRDFTVSWSGKDPGGSGIASYDVQYRVDGGDWADWIVDATPPASSADFAAGQDGKLYEFRARGEDRAGNMEAYGDPEASTTVDAEPPSTSVDPLAAFTTATTFVVSWTGEDDGSEIDYYDVRYRYDGGAWVLWQRQTLATSATFQALKDGRFDFEARAVDAFGLVEDFTGEPEASITVDTEPPTTVVDPLPDRTGDASFTVSWTGYDEVAGVDYYDVRYRYNGGSWVMWLPQTVATSVLFSSPHGDGIYGFEARAVDAYGLVEGFTGEVEASIMVDAVAPFVVPQVWIPFVVRGR